MCLDGPSNPVITASPERVAYVSGSDIILSCSADSKPTANSFYWMYNGIRLNMYGPRYNLINTTQNMWGEYTCVVQNLVTLRYAAVTKTIKIIGENTH